jgi:hypothetical protein
MSRTSTVLGRLALVTAGALFGTTLLVPGGAQAAEATAAGTTASAARAPVLGSDYGKAISRIRGTFGKNGVVTGTFTPKRFKVSDAGVLKAVGRLDATLTRGNGRVVGEASRKVTVKAASIEGTSVAPKTKVAARAPSCDVLNLVLGPLDLNLLGLEVHLKKVVLDIVAVSGAGNLLGNLLCAVAGLLDGTGVGGLTAISQILNSILAILRL